MEHQLEAMLLEANKAFLDADNEADLHSIRVQYLGKKGRLTAIMKDMAKLSAAERPRMGAIVNKVKDELSSVFEQQLQVLKQQHLSKRMQQERIDVTLPGRHHKIGSKHPITLITEELVEIFSFLGFSVAQGPEVEEDFYNFEALNLPKDHPARDMQDTFYITDNEVLRTHTSPVQIRSMLQHQPPLRIIAPGTVYRRDSDITHSPMFHQIEGFMVDEHITFGDLKGVLTAFIIECFGKNVGVRFRPSFFPFTEPSAEVDIQCVICGGKGCRVCQNSGWLEILGSGMIDPEVFASVNYSSQKYS